MMTDSYDLYVMYMQGVFGPWPFSQLAFLICITMFFNVVVSQFRAKSKITQNCLTYTFKNIVMQMRKANCGKSLGSADILPVSEIRKKMEKERRVSMGW